MQAPNLTAASIFAPSLLPQWCLLELASSDVSTKQHNRLNTDGQVKAAPAHREGGSEGKIQPCPCRSCHTLEAFTLHALTTEGGGICEQVFSEGGKSHSCRAAALPAVSGMLTKDKCHSSPQGRRALITSPLELS